MKQYFLSINEKCFKRSLNTVSLRTRCNAMDSPEKNYNF